MAKETGDKEFNKSKRMQSEDQQDSRLESY